MRRPTTVVAAGALLLLLGACAWSRPAGTGETDRIARVVADAISFPRQRTAAGLVRAASGRSAGVTVVEARELDARTGEDPLAHLVLRVHLDARPASGFTSGSPAVTACYDAEFNRYGVIGAPERRTCPVGARAVTVPPAPLTPQVPVGSDAALRSVLGRLPSGSTAKQVASAVRRGLPAAAPRTLDPEVGAVLDGRRVGVSVRGVDDCLLGVRREAGVLVWRPSRVQVQPGELSCDPLTALALDGTRSPH